MQQFLRLITHLITSRVKIITVSTVFFVGPILCKTFLEAVRLEILRKIIKKENNEYIISNILVSYKRMNGIHNKQK